MSSHGERNRSDFMSLASPRRTTGLEAGVIGVKDLAYMVQEFAALLPNDESGTIRRLGVLGVKIARFRTWISQSRTDPVNIDQGDDTDKGEPDQRENGLEIWPSVSHRHPEWPTCG
ncbi:hypothetical protein [Kitasatospora herbaricolor]|uniref:Uncharacterized protein n=1 Tax=Kitasatospora herbaricolor TaxID=68217 RepID=A0ABZ1W5X5_9ACTN|nr:hypothetical protein [Kitasatospora herbaricolor]